MSKNTESNKVICVKNVDSGSFINIEDIECLGKDIKQIRETLRCLYSKKIKFRVNNLNFNLEEGMASYIAVLEILSYLMEKQSVAVKAGIDTARRNGKQIGRRRIEIKDLPEVFLNSYDSYKEGNITKIDFSKICSCSRPTLDRWIRCYEEYIKK